ncbi:capsular polysaccharide synthesis protein [Acinetobacter sp. ACZLY 512]|uniref:glycosyltransferase family 32 protein n=1 Tax=Acinetobacter sp. ACZLY 512 TaxID=2911206 RepID=UPI00202606AA|nr:capsular polysaccharide synthesis protein [Acinetobacter sp. ACZLY 512]MCL9676796.1 capsular polysaccharide synthesis protein [Acinetobacter sp. ACZLY 512]
MLNKFYRFIIGLYHALFYRKDFDPAINFIEINRDIRKLDSIEEIPKIIWLYWEDENIPTLVKICMKSIIKHCKGFEVILLNNVTVNQYIDLPQLSQKILLAQKADLIRLELLSKYGGIWMDATVFLTRNIDWILKKIEYHDAFMFYSDECTSNIKNPISENWFIISRRNSRFINAWRDEFKKCITSENPVKYYDNVKNNKEMIQNLTVPDYLLCYISAIVCLNREKYNILYVSSGVTGHYYNYKHFWNGYGIAFNILLKDKDDIYIPPLLKFTSNSRKLIEFLLKYKVYKKKSILFK